MIVTDARVSATRSHGYVVSNDSGFLGWVKAGSVGWFAKRADGVVVAAGESSAEDAVRALVEASS